MAIDAVKLIDLAARGIRQTLIAKALGISESAVSQLLSRDDVAKKVKEAEAALASTELDSLKGIDRIKVDLLAKIGDLVQDSESLGESVAAYERLDRISNQKKGSGVETGDGIRGITIAIPHFIQNIIQISTNANNEIVTIDKNSMATMPTLDVHRLIKEAKNNDTEKQEPKADFDW